MAQSPKMPAPGAAKPAGKAKPHERAGSVEKGDHVYVHHPEHGPMSMRVRAHGGDGFTGETADGRRHNVPWDRMLGHKSRVGMSMTVLDQGADGAIVKDGGGRRRFIEGDMGGGEPGPDAASMPTVKKPDPLLDGLETMAKAMAGRAVLFAELPEPDLLKSAALANQPGLALRDVTDRAGHRTKRWMRTMPDQTKGRPPGKGDAPAAPQVHQHGDRVAFQHDNVRGQGTIISSGRDGATLRGDDGQVHMVRHDAIREKVEREPRKPDYPERQEGEEDKGYLKRVAHQLPDPDHLPEKHDRYFNAHPDAETVPVDKLRSTKSAEENAKGGNNSPKFMAAAYHGQVAKRDPIDVEEQDDGTFHVTDGNGTLTGIQKHGWKELPVRVTNKADRAARAMAASLTTPEEAKLPKAVPQPVKDEADLYAKAAPALEELKTWLDKGKGVSSKMGHRLMTKSPGDVTPEEWASPEDMLFIAPLKGAARAREKVEADYGGDWSQLRDVVRCSLAVPTLEDVKGVMDRLRASGMEVAQQPKNRFANPVPVGYRDMMLNVRLPSGMLCEVQLHAKPMMAAKNEGHHWYEVQRGIEATCIREQREPTPEETAQLGEAEAKQKEIYNAAWQKVSGAKGAAAGEEMKKGMGGMGRAMAGAARGAATAAYEHFEHDGAIYRRRAGSPLRSVSEILHGEQWKPYRGMDALKPALFGSPIEAPMLKGGDGGEEDAPMAKGGIWSKVALLFRRGK